MSIENIILDRDRRGVSILRACLPEDYCHQAASFVLANPGVAIIVTGFYILGARATETDGPPGAVVLGKALQSIGYDVVYVTDRYTYSLLKAIAGPRSQTIKFPITDDKRSKTFAVGILSKISPTILISIERCGPNDEGRYLNMRGQDITNYNARTEHLFSDSYNTIGIGDGGNEIGMGIVASDVAEAPTLVKSPCVTSTCNLIISSVSNWGGYGLVAAMSEQRGENLLPSVKAEEKLIKRTVDLGAVDGLSGKQEYKVDGFTLDENSEVLYSLHQYLEAIGIP